MRTLTTLARKNGLRNSPKPTKYYRAPRPVKPTIPTATKYPVLELVPPEPVATRSAAFRTSSKLSLATASAISSADPFSDLRAPELRVAAAILKLKLKSRFERLLQILNVR
jgi:hypothetical protein